MKSDQAKARVQYRVCMSHKLLHSKALLLAMCPKCLCALQTKSKAAEELERVRKGSEEGEGSGPRSFPSTSSVNCATPPVLTPSPPLTPQPAMNPPPPPPPVLFLEKPSSNSPMNPALAREAMLEAIRSGAAADKLKKVKCAPVWMDQEPLTIWLLQQFSAWKTHEGFKQTEINLMWVHPVLNQAQNTQTENKNKNYEFNKCHCTATAFSQTHEEKGKRKT